MILSELVNFRNELFKYSLSGIKENTDREVEKIAHLVQTQPFVSEELINDLEEKHKNVQETFDKFESSLNVTKNYVQNLIKNIEPKWFEESSQRYKNQFDQRIQKIHNDGITYYDDYGVVRRGQDPIKLQAKNDFVNQILNKSITLPDEIKQIIRSRILKYADWHYTGMIIGPGTESFINDMVANDPLYLIDEYVELLYPAINKFNKSYQQRLRPYAINECSNDNMLEKLPNNQFAICMAYNYFDHRPIHIIEQYVKELFKKLCSGGVLAITFNDCDRPSGVVLAENFNSFYTPGNLIVDLAKDIGYQEIFRINDDGPTTWIELKKPGNLSSVRGGQTLAKIHHK